MGTRGAFGVIIGEKEKISYNQFDSYPDGKGVEVLRWLRNTIADDNLGVVRKLAEEAHVIDEESKPAAEDIKRLKPYTDLGVSEQSTDDWYCLVRGTQGDLQLILESGYVLDYSSFPLESLFCEWAYIVDLDANVFEVYEGFQKKLPKKGRWKGRPTKAEDEANYVEHLKWCAKNDRKPWLKERSDYKAVELVASWPFDELPTEAEFLMHFEMLRARESIEPESVKKYPSDAANIVNRIVEEGLADKGKPHADEWAEIEEQARTMLAKHSSPGEVPILAART